MCRLFCQLREFEVSNFGAEILLQFFQGRIVSFAKTLNVGVEPPRRTYNSSVSTPIEAIEIEVGSCRKS